MASSQSLAPYYPEFWIACLYADQFERDPDESDSYMGPAKVSYLGGRGNRAIARVLDAFAECCVQEAQHQSVSISLTTTNADVTLYVAQVGGSLSRVVDHLRHIIDYIRRIRESVKLSTGPSEHKFDQRLIRDFEMFLYRSSFVKLRRRSSKHINTIVDEYASLLPVAGSYPDMDVHFARVHKLIDDFRTIRNRLPLQGSISDTEMLWLQQRIGALYTDWNPLASPNVLQRIDSRVKSAFSLEHYLRKICFIRHHCLTFMGVATFDRLAALLDGRCEIRPVPPERRRIIIDTRLDIFLPFMQRLGVPERDWARIHHLLSGNMLRMTKTTVTQMSMNADRSRIDLGLVDVHPECRLIAYHRAQLISKAFPYVGTSKVPCRGCQYYLDSFSKDLMLRPPRFSYQYDDDKPSVICFPWAAPLLEPLDNRGGYSGLDEHAMEMMTLRCLKGHITRCFERLQYHSSSISASSQLLYDI